MICTFLSLAALICSVESSGKASEQRAPVENISKVETTPEKLHLLEFLRVVKLGLDKDVFADPAAWERLGGAKVEKWSDQPGQPKVAEKVSLGSPLLDDWNAKKVAEPFEFGYVVQIVRADGSAGYEISLFGISNLACISPEEVSAIFGEARILIDLRPLPPHGPPLPGSPWSAASFQYDHSRSQLLTLGYEATDKSPPVPTCLSTLWIKFDVLPPPMYLRHQ